jgi:hypothetical protein
MTWSELRKRDYPTLRDHPERFWSKVDQSGGPSACWPWIGKLSSNGYGRAGRQGYAHRLAFALANGDEAVEQVNHTCDNRPCCNPAHLVAGTHATNARDMVERARHYTPFTSKERARHGLAMGGPARKEGYQ